MRIFTYLAGFVTRHRMLVVVAWLVAVFGIQSVAPKWELITHDGDFSYLPSYLPSVVGERWMSEAFPHQRGRSQIVLALVREQEPITKDDVQIGYDVARRVKNLLGAAQLAAAARLAREEETLRQDRRGAEADTVREQRRTVLQQAEDALQDALQLDTKLADYWDARVAADPSLAPVRPPRLAEIYHNQAQLFRCRGEDELAREARDNALQLNPNLQTNEDEVCPARAARLPLVDAWTWRESYFGSKLVSRDNQVRLVVLQLSNEFMAVDNMQVLETIEAELQPVRATLAQATRPGLTIIQSGSAAVGADLLRSAAASIRDTETVTVVLVVLFLALVYRSPLLVVVPLVTIVTSLLVSTGLVALLTQLSAVPGFSWWTLKVFSTTRIFIVVILFGAGTNFCLFLISRYKEELRYGWDHSAAVSRAVIHVGDALLASALTTILGLSTMIFADFGKFRYSGPVIGLCLAITLLTCLTLTPALIRIVGPRLFWPFRVDPAQVGREAASRAPSGVSGAVWHFWHFTARVITRRPGQVLVVSFLILAPLAGYGAWRGHEVTYDFLSGLPRGCPSRIGAETLRDHFPVGESGPVTVLVHRENAQFETPEGRAQIRQLSDDLHLPGVVTVRSAEDPLGDYAPGEKPGLLSDRGRTLRVLRAHPRTKSIFVAQTQELAGNVARFELILTHDPFSLTAIRVVDQVQEALQTLTQTPGSFWHGAQFALTGTTAAIRDLRQVTRQDNVRIQILVVLAVLAVLLVILRRPAVCLYLMLTVLFSYYVTIGITALLFQYAYGDAYQGLDWKVPLFLFVILVAVGQDYNVYLTTRVFEEQARIGLFAGLRRAVVRTGGIITSCGVIMAATFLSMTSAAWPSLLPAPLARWWSSSVGPVHSILEMGFALALGVLLDTLVVRPILVPAFLALLCRWRSRQMLT
ncbi:MAG: MMPL family transporter [Planctomycetaceae bacterium]|nr:MMPL family transporter [Planctomycetaceae bacterium]